MVRKMKKIILNKKIIFSLIILLFILLSLSGLLQNWENKALDQLIIADYIFSPAEINDISIITIDKTSINKLGGWPLSRQFYSQALEILNKNGAELIGLDLILSNYSSKKEDNELKKTFNKYDNIVLAMSADLRLRKNIFQEKVEVIGLNKAVEPFFENTKSGHVNFLADSDGIIRELKPYLNYNNKNYPSFSLELALNSNKVDKKTKILKDIKKENLILNPPGPSATIPHLSFHNLLNKNFNRELIEDRIVIIGVSDPALGDSYMTSFSRYGYLNGVELNGYAVYNYLNRNYIIKSTLLVNLIILLILALIIIFSYNYLQKQNKIKFLNNFRITVVVTIIYLIFHFSLFYNNHYYLNLITPLIMIFFIYLINFIFRYFKSEKEREFIKKTFSRYISKEVMKKLLENPEKLETKGSKKELSILFVDIRSFSDYAQNVSSERAVADLNHTYEKLTKIILKYNGTIDKYLGDGLLAFFGAPINQQDHHLKAFQAAKEVQDLSVKGKIPFKLGIGLNSGQVIVGNIGSKDRLDYTVIGQAVNQAALFVDKAKSDEIIISKNYFEILEKDYKNKMTDIENLSIWEEIKNEKDNF